jgi:adenylate cyclase
LPTILETPNRVRVYAGCLSGIAQFADTPVYHHLRPTLRLGVSYFLPLAVLLIAATAQIVAPNLLGRLSPISFDLYQRLAPRAATQSPVTIVDIDGRSLAAIGQWPWPRTIVAHLVDRLAKAGAAGVSADIDFAEPDRTSPRMLLPLLVQDGADARQAGAPLDGLPDPDVQLARAFRTVPVVTGFILSHRGGTRAPAAEAGFAFAGDNPLGHVGVFASCRRTTWLNLRLIQNALCSAARPG